MTLEDVLQLPIKEDSILKIESFIASSSNIENVKARLYLSMVLSELNREEEAINILFLLLKEDVQSLDKNLYIETLDSIIDIYIKTANYDDVDKYILLKNEVYEANMLYLSNMDYIRISLAKEDYNEALRLMKNILNDDIPNDLRLDIYKEIIKIYIKDKKYDFSIEYIVLLKDLCITQGNMKEYFNAVYYEAMAKYNINEYNQAYELNCECLNNRDLINEEALPKMFVLDIKILYALKEYRKAMVNEAEYESAILSSDPYIQDDFFDICILLYKQLKNKFSLSIYEERKTNLKFPKKKQKIIKTVVQKTLEDKTVAKTYKNDIEGIYHVLENIFKIQEANINITPKVKFRDLLLPLLIESFKVVKFDEAVLLLVENHYHGYHYKKERLYDKDFVDISNTIPYKVLSNNKEIVYTTREELVGVKDIICDRDYMMLEYQCAIAFPLYCNNEMIGVMMYSSFDQKMLDGFAYETLKYLTNLINDRYLVYETLIDTLTEYRAYYEAFNLVDEFVKYSIGDRIFINKKLSDYLNIPQKLNDVEYLSYIGPEDFVQYRNFLKTEEETITYKIKKYSMVENVKYFYKKDVKVSVSILKDISIEVKEEKREQEIIYQDHLTKVLNLYAYYRDVVPLIRDDKFSMLMVDMDHFKDINDCYGVAFGNEILRSMAHYLTIFFSDYDASIYRISGDDFLIIIKHLNDLRTINRISKQLLEYLFEQVNKRSVRLSIKFSIGSLRYRVQVVEKMPDKLLGYVDFALRDAKTRSNDDSGYCSFNRDRYNEDFKEREMINHINEAIDLSKIGINYTQVINPKNQMIAFYSISPHIFDLLTPEEEIRRVISLRGLNSKLEKYMIRKSLKEVLSVYEKYNKYFKICVSVSYTTIKNEGFVEMLGKITGNTKLPKGLLTIELVGDNRNIIDEIKQIREFGIDIISSDITDVLKFDVDYLKINYLSSYLETEKGANTTRGLLSFTKEIGANLFITNVLSKTEISILNSLGVEYISFGKKIFIRDIIRKIEVTK